METIVLKILFITSVSAQFRKHIFVPDRFKWTKAQKYCRDHYTDLSPLTTWSEEVRLKNATRIDGKFWIGLYRNGTEWWWSGGGRATYTPWDVDEPDKDQKCVAVCWYGCKWEGWHDYSHWQELPFFCFNLILKEHKRTWQQAFDYCRKNNTALTSLTSYTEHSLALRKIQQNHITERVWIGLRYLGDRWLWMDGNDMTYQAWPKGGHQDHQCPTYKRCGALNKQGLWESWDCTKKLNFLCY